MTMDDNNDDDNHGNDKDYDGNDGQGWEFAHLISKNEGMSDTLKKISDSLIRSFLVSDLSDSLTIAHFL